MKELPYMRKGEKTNKCQNFFFKIGIFFSLEDFFSSYVRFGSRKKIIIRVNGVPFDSWSRVSYNEC